MRVATPLARLSRHRVPRSFSRRGSGIRGPSGNGPVKLITRERQSPCRDHSGERDSARARARSFVRFSFSLAPVRSLAIASRIRNYHSLIPRCSSSGPVTVRESSGVAAPSRAARNRACRTRLERKYADRACPDRVERHGAKRGL